MTTKTPREVPAGMQRVYRRFERWRSSHRGRLHGAARELRADVWRELSGAGAAPRGRHRHHHIHQDGDSREGYRYGAGCAEAARGEGHHSGATGFGEGLCERHYPPARLQTADQVAAILGDLELYGLGRDEVDDFFARIDAVTLEQANAAARRYYKPDNLTFVLLGNAAKIREAAGKYAPKVAEVAVSKPGFGRQ